MPTDAAAEELPGWSDEELAETANENPGAGAEAGLPDPLRFRMRVTQTIRNRLRAHEPDRDAPPGVFLLLPTPPDGVQRKQLKTVPMLDNGRAPLEGTVWFVSSAVGQGLGLPLSPQLDDAELFSLVADELAVGDCPAIVFESRNDPPTARLYARGLAEPDDFVELPLRMTVDVDGILEVVDRVHRDMLVTPDGQGAGARLWANKAKHWARSDAEATIHSHLRVGLLSRYSTCTIRPEQPGISGRLDLEVEERVEGEEGLVMRHAVLELKVLRRWTESGRSVSARRVATAVREGVEQAAAYRREHEHRAAALCCFDMREEISGEHCFGPVRALARTRRVRLRVWHVFASSKAYRAYTEGGS